MTLAEELLELSNQVNSFCKLHSFSEITSNIELSEDDDISLPYTFSCEALEPGHYKGFEIEERDIVLAKDTIFEKEENFSNDDINIQHKSARKPDSTVLDLVGKVTKADYNFNTKKYILTGEIYDKNIAYKIAKKLIKFVSLAIKPGKVEYMGNKKYARDLTFQELSFVRAPGYKYAKIL